MQSPPTPNLPEQGHALPVRSIRRRGYTTTTRLQDPEGRSRKAGIPRQPSMPLLSVRATVIPRPSQDILNSIVTEGSRSTITKYERGHIPINGHPSRAKVAASSRPANDLSGTLAPPAGRPNRTRSDAIQETVPPTLRQTSSTNALCAVPTRPPRTQKSKVSITFDAQKPTPPTPVPSRGAKQNEAAPSSISSPPGAFPSSRVIASNRLTSTTIHSVLSATSTGTSLSGVSDIAAVHADLFYDPPTPPKRGRVEDGSHVSNRLTVASARTDFTSVTTDTILSGAATIAAIHADLFDVEPLRGREIAVTPKRSPKKERDPVTGRRIKRLSTASTEAVRSLSPEPAMLPMPLVIPRRPSNASIAGLCSVAMLSDDESETYVRSSATRYSQASTTATMYTAVTSLPASAEPPLPVPSMPIVDSVTPCTVVAEHAGDNIARQRSDTVSSAASAENGGEVSESASTQDHSSISDLSVNSHPRSSVTSFSHQACAGSPTVAPPSFDGSAKLSRSASALRPAKRSSAGSSGGSSLTSFEVRYSDSDDKSVVVSSVLVMLNYLCEVQASEDSLVTPVIHGNRCSKDVVGNATHAEVLGKALQEKIGTVDCFDDKSFRHSVLMIWFWWTLRLEVPVEVLISWITELWTQLCRNGQLRLAGQIKHWVSRAWRPRWDEPHAETLLAFVKQYVRPTCPASADMIIAGLARYRYNPPAWPSYGVCLFHAELEASPPSHPPSTFPCCAELADYTVSAEGVAVFAEQLTLVMSGAFRAVNPLEMAIAWYDVGDQPTVLDQPFKRLYNGLFAWVKTSLLLAADSVSFRVLATFWLQVGKILYREHLNFGGAAAIAEGLDEEQIKMQFQELFALPPPLPPPPPVPRGPKRNLLKKARGKLEHLRPSKVGPAPAPMPSPEMESPDAWVNEALQLARGGYAEYNRRVALKSPFVPILGKHKGAMIAWRGVHQHAKRKPIEKTDDGDVLVDLRIIRSWANVVEPMQEAHRPFKFPRRDDICHWLNEQLDFHAPPDPQLFNARITLNL